MFEKIKDFLWIERGERDGFCYFHQSGTDFTPVCNILDKNTRYAEIKKEDLPYRGEGWSTAVQYMRFAHDNSRILLTIPEFTELILNCAELLENDFFPDKTYEILAELLKLRAKDAGLEIIAHPIYQIYFGADKNTPLNLSKKQGNSIRFYSTKANNGDYDFILPKEYGEMNNSINCGTLIDNKIVSWSGTTYISSLIAGNEIILISIETLENYRQKGYAVSNVVSFTEYLLSGSEEVKHVNGVIYDTNSNNINSQKTAKSAGLIEIAHEFYVSCRRIEQEK